MLLLLIVCAFLLYVFVCLFVVFFCLVLYIYKIKKIGGGGGGIVTSYSMWYYFIRVVIGDCSPYQPHHTCRPPGKGPFTSFFENI